MPSSSSRTEVAGRGGCIPFLSYATACFLAIIIAILATSSDAMAAEKKKTISFGVIPRFNPHVMYEYYQPLMDYLGRETSYDFQLRLSKSYMQTIEDLEKGVTDVAYLGGATFALARHRFGARALVKPLNPEGRSTYQCYIIVREDSQIKTLKDLKGKSLAFGPRRATTGSLIPSYMLTEAGVTLDMLKELRNFPHHEDVAKAILKGTFDAGAVKDVVAWKYKGQGIRVIKMSEELPNAPVAAGPSLSKEAETELVGALLRLNRNTPEGRAIRAGWGPELKHGFVPARNEDYDFLYEKITSIPKGCGKKCHSSNPFLEK
jgi:phosphonate transport system substrate-binding protein